MLDWQLPQWKPTGLISPRAGRYQWVISKNAHCTLRPRYPPWAMLPFWTAGISLPSHCKISLRTLLVSLLPTHSHLPYKGRRGPSNWSDSDLHLMSLQKSKSVCLFLLVIPLSTESQKGIWPLLPAPGAKGFSHSVVSTLPAPYNHLSSHWRLDSAWLTSHWVGSQHPQLVKSPAWSVPRGCLGKYTQGLLTTTLPISAATSEPLDPWI